MEKCAVYNEYRTTYTVYNAYILVLVPAEVHTGSLSVTVRERIVPGVSKRVWFIIIANTMEVSPLCRQSASHFLCHRTSLEKKKS